MDVIHAEEVEIARERARAVRGVSSILSSNAGHAGQAMMIHGFRYVEQIERLIVRRDMLVNRRANITGEDRRSAIHATERAISARFNLELIATDHQQEEAAPEIEGLKRVSITKQNNSSYGEEQGGGGEIDVCAICHEEWKIGDDVRSVVGCSHAYHYNCISKWIKRKPTCPMCRYEIPTNINNKKRRVRV